MVMADALVLERYVNELLAACGIQNVEVVLTRCDIGGNAAAACYRSWQTPEGMREEVLIRIDDRGAYQTMQELWGMAAHEVRHVLQKRDAVSVGTFIKLKKMRFSFSAIRALFVTPLFERRLERDAYFIENLVRAGAEPAQCVLL